MNGIDIDVDLDFHTCTMITARKATTALQKQTTTTSTTKNGSELFHILK
jgi:hypothetical protein